jgi:hypothetical protein
MNAAMSGYGDFFVIFRIAFLLDFRSNTAKKSYLEISIVRLKENPLLDGRSTCLAGHLVCLQGRP